jgi:hypothetical protein
MAEKYPLHELAIIHGRRYFIVSALQKPEFSQHCLGQLLEYSIGKTMRLTVQFRSITAAARTSHSSPRGIGRHSILLAYPTAIGAARPQAATRPRIN